MILKKIISAVFAAVLIAFTLPAQAEEADNYILKTVADIPATKIIYCTNSATGEWDHSIYFHRAEQKRNYLQSFYGGITHVTPAAQDNYLVIICHGVDTRSANYMIQINGQQRADYWKALEEILNHWEQAGYFNNLKYDYVLVHTCFSGNVRESYSDYCMNRARNSGSYVHGSDMAFVSKSTDVNFYGEYVDEYGNTRIRLSSGQRRISSMVENTSASRAAREYNGKKIKMHICK